MNINLIDFLKKINLNKIFTGAHKTINVVNKAIPVYKQIKPNIGTFKNLISNKKDSSKQIIDEIKNSRPIKLKRNTPKTNRNISNDSLTFFQ